MAWRLKSRNVIDDVYVHLIGKASTQYVTGALYKVPVTTTAGSGTPVVLSGQTDQPFMLVDSLDIQPYNGQSMGNVNGKNLSPLRPATDLLTTTVGERVMGILIDPSLIFECDVTPLLGGASAGAAAVTNTNVAQAIAAYGGSTGDFTGGVVYLPEQDWQGIITSSAVGGGNVTLVFTPPAPRACTVGDTIQALPFGVGAAPKFDSTAPSTTLSNAVADVGGGNVLVTKVEMQFGATKGTVAHVSCRIKSPI